MNQIILMTLMFTVFKSLIHVWENMVYVVALATMFIGNLFALRQQNMKRFLAFSSIAQAGFILLGLITGTQLGVATIVYFVLIYIFSNLAAFGVVQTISLKTGKENMDDYNGLYRTNPKLSLVMMLALFSLAGIPTEQPRSEPALLHQLTRQRVHTQHKPASSISFHFRHASD